MKGAYRLILIVSVFLLSHCMTASQTIQVTHYKDQKVYMGKNRFYHVGILPQEWKVRRSRLPGIQFYNSKLRGTIVTDGFCEKKNYESNTTALTQQRLGGLPDLKITKQVKMKKMGDGGLRTWASSIMDQKKVYLDFVVTHQDGCQFEFIAIMPGEKMPAVERDFEKLFRGFSF